MNCWKLVLEWKKSEGDVLKGMRGEVERRYMQT
jgi:hypothetical protein